MYTVIDLFAGAGGFSLGFMQTQKYVIKIAFENSPYMQETYRSNHPDVELHGDVCEADYDAIINKHGNIDIVIGGPPCQGFSSANRQKNHAINQNNMLVKEYLRAVLALRPKAFVMENVSSLQSELHRFYMDENDIELVERYKIPAHSTALELLSVDFAFDGVLELVKTPASVQRFLWPEDHYFALNIVYKAARSEEKLQKALKKYRTRLTKIAKNYLDSSCDNHIIVSTKRAFSALMEYYNDELPATSLKELIEPAIMLQRMLSKAQEIYDNHIVVDNYSDSNGIVAEIRTFSVYDYLVRILTEDYALVNDVLCAADFGAPQKRMRFLFMGVRRDIAETVSLPKGQFTPETYRTVRDAIADLEEVQTVYHLIEDKNGQQLDPKADLSPLAQNLRNAQMLRNHIVTLTTPIAMERFKVLRQGQNFHALDNALKTNTYTDVSRTQNTIYLRLSYDEPSGTVVNVRKSMWIHPTLDRAISVRETARLQTFPDSFVFYGSKDKQYQQVGNAVPPIMAKSIAKKLANILSKSLRNMPKCIEG